MTPEEEHAYRMGVSFLPPPQIRQDIDLDECVRMLGNTPEVQALRIYGGNISVNVEPFNRPDFENDRMIRDNPRMFEVTVNLRGQQAHHLFPIDVSNPVFVDYVLNDVRVILGCQVVQLSEEEVLTRPIPRVSEDEYRRMTEGNWGPPTINGGFAIEVHYPNAPEWEHADNEYRTAILRIAKSKQWLIEHLNEDQKIEFQDSGVFTVKGEHTGRLYKITSQSQMNVQLMPNVGQSDGAILCVAPKDSKFPLWDQLLMQKLMLETKEEEFLKVAKRRREDMPIYGGDEVNRIRAEAGLSLLPG